MGLTRLFKLSNGEALKTEDPTGGSDLPARIKVDFSKLKIASRLVIGLLALGFFAYYVPELIAEDKLGFVSISMSAILGIVGLWFTIVSAYHLFVRKPVLTVDAGGLVFLKHEPIAWTDVSSVQIRVTPSSRDLPLVFLKVTPIGKRASFEVELTQTTTEPEDLVGMLKRYVAAYRDRSPSS